MDHVPTISDGPEGFEVFREDGCSFAHDPELNRWRLDVWTDGGSTWRCAPFQGEMTPKIAKRLAARLVYDFDECAAAPFGRFPGRERNKEGYAKALALQARLQDMFGFAS